MAVVRKEAGATAPVTKKKKAATEELVGTYKLPSEFTEPVSSLSECLTLVFGPKKIGKTAMLAEADKHFFMATEAGYKGLRVRKEDIPNWDMALRVYRALKNDKASKTVIVDTVDLLFRACEKYTCKDLDIVELADAEWGKGWSQNRKRFQDFMNSLCMLNKGVFLLSHSMEQSIKQHSGLEYDMVTATMPKGAREIIEPMVDIWICCQYDGDRRIMTVEGDDHITAGHRMKGRFLTKDGQRLRNISMGKGPDEAWQNLNDAFNNRYVPERDEDVVETRREKKKAKVLKLK